MGARAAVAKGRLALQGRHDRRAPSRRRSGELGRPPCAAPANWVDRHAPAAFRPWLKLGRFDRPVGIWLLMIPGWQGIALADSPQGRWPNLYLLAAIAVGAALMRAAGCAYNDIVDRDFDARVARTAGRPIPSGQISVNQAWAFVVVCSLFSLGVLLTMGPVAIALGVGSLLLVAAYPFMKRITWWPQAWLGLVFAWAAPVGWTATRGSFDPAAAFLYAGTICWVVGYDTVYALQDREDDELAGVKSSARRLGRHARTGVAICYAAALAFWAAAFWTLRPQWLALIALLPMALHLLLQVARLDTADGANALATFRSNRFAGLLMFLACLAVGTTL